MILVPGLLGDHVRGPADLKSVSGSPAFQHQLRSDCGVADDVAGWSNNEARKTMHDCLRASRRGTNQASKKNKAN